MRSVKRRDVNDGVGAVERAAQSSRVVERGDDRGGRRGRAIETDHRVLGGQPDDDGAADPSGGAGDEHSHGDRFTGKGSDEIGSPGRQLIEWRPIRLPSVSTTSEMNPYSPIDILARCTLPPAAAARASSTAQSAQLK